MATWEQCRNYGLIKILPSGALQLYYDRHYFLTAPNPNAMMTVESAMWQGNTILIRGRNQYGEPMCYMLRDLYEADHIVL